MNNLSNVSKRARGRPARSAEPVGDDDAMLSQAFTLFSETGYESASMREIARRMGVSHNLLHLRFQSKEEIWRRAVDLRIGQSSLEVWEVFEKSPAVAIDHLAALIRAYCEGARRDPEISRMIMIESVRDSWRLDHLVERFIGPFQRRLDLLLKGIAEPGVEPISTIAFMSLLVNGVGVYFASRPLMERIGQGAEADNPDAMIERFVTALVRAVHH